MDLNKIKLGVAALSGEIYIYRHGKNEEIVLDKRNVTGEVMKVVTEYILEGMPTGATLNYNIGDKTYEMTVKPVDDSKAE